MIFGLPQYYIFWLLIMWCFKGVFQFKELFAESHISSKVHGYPIKLKINSVWVVAVTMCTVHVLCLSMMQQVGVGNPNK